MKKLVFLLLFLACSAGSMALAQSPPKDSVLASRAHELDKLGLNQYMKQEYEEALQSAYTCIRLYRKAGLENTTASGQAYGNAALLLLKLEKPEKALTYIEKSIAIYEKVDPNHVYLKSAKEWKQKIIDAMG